MGERERVLECRRRTGHGRRKIAEELGISEKRVRRFLREARESGELLEKVAPVSGEVHSTRVRDGDELKTTTTSTFIQTEEQAIEFHKVDLDRWERSYLKVESWTVTMGKDKTDTGKPETYTNYLVDLRFKPRIADPLQVALDNLCNRLEDAPLPDPVTHELPQDGYLTEIGLYDHHVGLLAWEPETGENYDVGIASSLYCEAADDMMQTVRGFPLSRILLPVGNDFFHINDPTNTTPKNKNRLDTEGRLAKVFEAGMWAVINTVNKLRQIAPVDVVFVGGNHDPETSYFLCQVLKAQFRRDESVNVDISPKKYKKYRWGNSLIGLAHGEVKWDRLPAFMAEEWKHDWADTVFREWHVGHRHARKETRYNAADTFGGVSVMTLPSLCPADWWHYENLFVRRVRTADIHLWGFQTGKKGYFCTHSGKALKEIQ